MTGHSWFPSRAIVVECGLEAARFGKASTGKTVVKRLCLCRVGDQPANLLVQPGTPMKSAILVFPGINRERDMARALRLASGREAAMVWHAETALPKGTDLVVVPGGFSYGDYLRCGAIAARSPVMDAVRKFAADGGLVLGVCNGFQILCESGLLPGVLMRNAQLKFVCRDVHLRVERSDTPFTRGYNAGQVIRVPVAH